VPGSYGTNSFSFSSPLGDLAALGLLDTDDLVAVEEAERVEGGFDLDVGNRSGSANHLIDFLMNRSQLLTFLIASTVLWPSSCGR
jgi:hypothetical protein